MAGSCGCTTPAGPASGRPEQEYRELQTAWASLKREREGGGKTEYLDYLHVIKYTVWANCHMRFELTEKLALEQCCPVSISDLNMSV